MDLYDNNHDEQIYTATDFIEFVIDNAKTKMSSFYLDNEFKELNTIEKLKNSIDVLGLYEFKNVTNEFIKVVNMVVIKRIKTLVNVFAV